MIARRSSVVSSPAKGLDCRKRAASSLEERSSATTSGSGVESSILRHSRRAVAGSLLEPALQVSPRHVQELRVRLELGRDRLVQGQVALLYPLVAAHANSIVASLAFLAEPTFAPGGGSAQGAGDLDTNLIDCARKGPCPPQPAGR